MKSGSMVSKPRGTPARDAISIAAGSVSANSSRVCSVLS